MTPELERALRLNPRLRKSLRDRQAALLAAINSGDSAQVLEAATAWGDAERAAAADLAAKKTNAPRHRVSFLIEETYYEHFCETALEYELSPGEVARRYCISGYTFSSLIWDAVRSGGTVGDWVRVETGRPNIAELALPNFTSRSPVGSV